MNVELGTQAYPAVAGTVHAWYPMRPTGTSKSFESVVVTFVSIVPFGDVVVTPHGVPAGSPDSWKSRA